MKSAETSSIDVADQLRRLAKFELISLTQLPATKKLRFLADFSNVNFTILTPVNSSSGMVHLKNGKNLELPGIYGRYILSE